MRTDLAPIFQGLNLPVVQLEFASDETPPVDFRFIEYHHDGSTNFVADNKVYKRIDHWRVSVYGKVTDMASFYGDCEALEAALDAAGIIAKRSPDIPAEDGIVYAAFDFDLPR